MKERKSMSLNRLNPERAILMSFVSVLQCYELNGSVTQFGKIHERFIGDKYSAIEFSSNHLNGRVEVCATNNFLDSSSFSRPKTSEWVKELSNQITSRFCAEVSLFDNSITTGTPDKISSFTIKDEQSKTNQRSGEMGFLNRLGPFGIVLKYRLNFDDFIFEMMKINDSGSPKPGEVIIF
jgi:hypothetical protein